MKEIVQMILNIIEEICKYQKEKCDIISNRNLILKLTESLQQYSNRYLTSISVKNSKDKTVWIEMLTDCMNAIENRDNILLIDTLKYGIKPFINDMKEEVYNESYYI